MKIVWVEQEPSTQATAVALQSIFIFISTPIKVERRWEPVAYTIQNSPLRVKDKIHTRKGERKRERMRE